MHARKTQRSNFTPGLAAAAILLAATTGLAAGAAERLVVNERAWHLGRAGAPEWDEFAGTPPDSERLDISFTTNANARESALFIRHDDVRQDWKVELNGRSLGRLFNMEADLVGSFPIAAGALRDGENQLSLLPPATADDIRVKEIWIVSAPLKDALSEALITVQVIDADTGEAMPARITVVNAQGALAAMSGSGVGEHASPAAVRPGVAYIGAGGARLGLLAGEYTVYASRGFEFGVATQSLKLGNGETKSVRLAIRREVPTPGWISSDTHVHTATFSRHGDATIDERMLTLAGEGIELPIATDHNFHTDFRESAARMGMAGYFTPVIGNEVTTGTAHFNVFPVRPDVRVPDFRIPDWRALIEHIRDTTGARVVVLNHPMNVHNGFQPFAATNFNNVTGESLGGQAFTFDAIELLNSSAQQSDYLTVHRGWFALLNHGYRITGVGSSDGHDVSRYIVGQGRTYIASSDSNAAAINVEDACESLLAGRALVSMGLLVDLTVDGRFGVGDLATELSEKIEVSIRVLGPSWVSATNVVLYANGQVVRESALAGNAGLAGLKTSLNWTLDRPSHDVHLVAIATGPGVIAPFWAIPRPYQPSSTRWEGRVIGSTNPVWLDADGNGRFDSARDLARQLVKETGTDPAKILPALAIYDQAVASQAASLSQAAGANLESERWRQALSIATLSVRRGFQNYLESLP